MEYERVRDEIARMFCNKDGWEWEKMKEYYTQIGETGARQYYYELADQILSLDGIEIKSDDQTQPEFLALGNISKLDLVNETRKSMIEPDAEGKHFVRVIPKPKRK